MDEMDGLSFHLGFPVDLLEKGICITWGKKVEEHG